MKTSGKHLGRKKEFLLDAVRKTIFIVIIFSYGPIDTILMENIVQSEIYRVRQFEESQTVKICGPEHVYLTIYSKNAIHKIHKNIFTSSKKVE